MDEQLKDTQAERAAMEQLQAQLKSIFKNLPYEVPLILFTQPGKNDLFITAARFLIRAVREVTSKVTLREYDLNHPMAKKMNVDGVFIAIGYTPAVELAKKLGIELTPEGYIKRDSRHRTNIPGIYSAGDVEGGYKQIVTATGQGAEAALAIFEDLVNPYWKSKTAAA